MNNKKMQLSFVAFLALLFAGVCVGSMLGGHKSQEPLKGGAKDLKAQRAHQRAAHPVPSLAQPSDSNDQLEQIRTGAIDEVRQTRLHPTAENLKNLVALINTNKDTAVLSEALNTLGVLAQHGIDSEQTCKLLAQKALDKNFPSRGEALLVASILEKNKALPVVAAFIDKGAASAENPAMLGWASRALGMIATPQSVPVIEKVISQTSDPDVLGASFAALGKAASPEAFSLLKQRTQTSDGQIQAYGAAALSESKDPQTRQWIARSIQDGTLGKQAVSMLAMMPSAPDIFQKVLAEGALSPTKQLDILQQIAPGLQAGPHREKLALALAPLVYSGNPKVQAEAITLIGHSGGKKVADIIKPFLSSKNPEVRKDAFFSYMKYTNADNYRYLFDFLDDQSPETRRMAIFMIGKFYGASDREALEQAAQSDDAFIRDKAGQYLSSLN
ncbi:MAG: HEAT repeat domain-containing protein [Syntrophobacteraceae bacterium]